MIRFPYKCLTRTCDNNEKLLCRLCVYRLTPLTTPPVEKSTMMNLSLQEIILIGNASEQVRGVGGMKIGRDRDPTVTRII